MSNAGSTWFKLDNAGKLYPAIRSSAWSSVYRMSVYLKAPVDPALLQKAVEITLPRFPSFSVRLRQGFFWYYLEKNPLPFIVQPDNRGICSPTSFKENNDYLFRIFYFNNVISVEYFHALTDGSGAIVFIKTLTAQYLNLLGYPIPSEKGILNISAPPLAEETDDSYARLPFPKIRKSRKEAKAFRFPFAKEMPRSLHIISGSIPLSPLKHIAKKHNVTITEYIVSAMIYTIYQAQQKGSYQKNKPVKVSVPVNMRQFFPSKTLRNFAYFVNPGIDPKYGQYTFEEVLQEIHHFMRYHINPKFLFSSIGTNVASERNLFIRLCPLPIKNLIMRFIFIQTGEKTVTSTFTNVGSFTLPEEMALHVDGFEVLLGPAYTAKSNASGSSYQDKMKISFTRNTYEAELEKNFFQFLVKQGLHVTIESNWR